MKKFLFKISFFILSLIVIISLFDFAIRSNNTLYKQKVKDILKESKKIKVLSLGNSRATFSINPLEIDLFTFNFSHIAQSIYYDKRIALKFLDSMPNLQYVLISCDYHSLYFSKQINNTREMNIFYGTGIPYKSKSYLLPKISPFLFGYSPKTTINILKKKVLRQLKNIHKKRILTFAPEVDVNVEDTLIQGFLPTNGTNRKSFQDINYKKRIAFFDSTITHSAEKKEILDDLTEFILVLKKRNITPVLFNSPTYTEYNALLNRDILKSNTKTIDSLTQLFGLDYFNFFQDTTFKINDFVDIDHLNKQGSIKFSRKINNLLNTLYNSSNN